MQCPKCGGDCGSANPPVYNCPMRCGHDWARQDENGKPYCAECGLPWGEVFSQSKGQDYEVSRADTKIAILQALLREARQYVSDAGSDDSNETKQHSTALLGAIDEALRGHHA